VWEGGALRRKARLTEEEVNAIIMANQGLPDDQKLTHVLIRQPAGSSEIEAMLDMLAGESEAEDTTNVGENLKGNVPLGHFYIVLVIKC
jgi:hypothetical protein